METMGKTMILAGAVIVILGVALLFFDRIPLLGKLPGDIVIKRENFQVYVPVTSSILISVVLSLVFFAISHFRGR